MFPTRLSFSSGVLFFALMIGFQSCGSQTENQSGASATIVTASSKPEVSVPEFDAAGTYSLIQKQVDFGPRVPGTPAQKECADWLEQYLNQYCDTVYLQHVEVTAGNGKKLPCFNLIGAIRPEATNRVLLLAHWDTRPWADQDKNNPDEPVLGADDGGSGTAVLLTIAKVLQEHPLPEGWGVDILLTDVEDYGKSVWGDDSYALGTQYWAKNPHISGYHARAGILLDMVGARNARFPLEGYSAYYASHVQKEVWEAASQAGYSSYFVYENGGQITDDHVPVNEILKIPTIDIINLPASSMTGFGSYWHTHQDNMDNIDQRTLKAVGQTVLQYLYSR